MAKSLMRLLLSILLALSPVPPGVAASDPAWKVDTVSLKPQGGLTARLTVGLSRGGDTFEIAADVRLTSVSDYFVFRNRLVVMGEQGRAFGVVIFDLTSRKLLDWFACWEATRISDSWIAFVEWYPEHGIRWPTDVVLIYDLDKPPSQNRLGSAKLGPAPPPVTDASVAVGMPVLPAS